MIRGRPVGPELPGPGDSSAPAVAALVAVNLVPLVGVAALGWSVGALLSLYWLENAVIGGWNGVKLFVVGGEEAVPAASLRVRPANAPLVAFFGVHYGLFWVGHGSIVLSQFVAADPSALATVTSGPFLAAIVGLVGSHGVSFARNFVAGGEYRTATVDDLFYEPYRRVVVLHLTVLFGGALVDGLGDPLVGLLLLVLFKTGFDLYEHLQQHRRLGGRA